MNIAEPTEAPSSTIAQFGQELGRQTAAVAHAVTIAAGHVAHQVAATGVSYFTREVAAKLIRDALATHPEAALTAQGCLTLLAACSEALVIARNGRNPEEATKGYHNLSADQWGGKTPAERIQLNEARKTAETRMAAGHVLAVAAHLGVAIYGVKTGQPELAAAMVSTEAKSIIFSTLRDTIQDAFQTITTNNPTTGLLGSKDLWKAGGAYGAAQMLGNLALVAPRVGAASLRGTGWKPTLSNAAMSAAMNTAIEAVDMTYQGAMNAANFNARQRVSPNLRPPTGERLLDQTPVRWAFFAEFFAPLDVLDAGMKAGGASETQRQAAVAIAAGVLGLLLLPPIVKSWQSSSNVRASTPAQGAVGAQVADEERQDDVNAAP
jgi:hypothetical protein